MKKSLLILLLMAGSAFAGSNFSIGIGVNIGGPGYVVAPAPPPLRPYRYVARPGPAYVWVPGYWYPAGPAYRPSYRWRDGYWSVPPRGKGRWVAPKYKRGRYYNGYWR